MGDAILSCNGIGLQEAKHSEAVKVLSSLHGEIVMEVLYVAPDDSSDEDEADWEKKDEKRFHIFLVVNTIPYSMHVWMRCGHVPKCVHGKRNLRTKFVYLLRSFGLF